MSDDKEFFPVLKEWAENIAGENACTTVIPYQKRRMIIDMWFDPANGYDLAAIADKVGVDQRAVATIIGSHPLVREVEDSMHRARLYQLRRQLDSMQDDIVGRMKMLMDSEKSEDWDRALSQVRKYLSLVDQQIKSIGSSFDESVSSLDLVIQNVIEGIEVG